MFLKDQQRDSVASSATRNSQSRGIDCARAHQFSFHGSFRALHDSVAENSSGHCRNQKNELKQKFSTYQQEVPKHQYQEYNYGAVQGQQQYSRKAEASRNANEYIQTGGDRQAYIHNPARLNCAQFAYTANTVQRSGKGTSQGIAKDYASGQNSRLLDKQQQKQQKVPFTQLSVNVVNSVKRGSVSIEKRRLSAGQASQKSSLAEKQSYQYIHAMKTTSSKPRDRDGAKNELVRTTTIQIDAGEPKKAMKKRMVESKENVNVHIVSTKKQVSGMDELLKNQQARLVPNASSSLEHTMAKQLTPTNASQSAYQVASAATEQQFEPNSTVTIQNRSRGELSYSFNQENMQSSFHADEQQNIDWYSSQKPERQSRNRATKTSSSRKSSKEMRSTRSANRSCSRDSLSSQQIKLSSSNVRIQMPQIAVMPLERAEGDMKVVFLDVFEQLMRQKEQLTAQEQSSSIADRRSSSQSAVKHKSVLAAMKYFPEAGALFLRCSVPLKNTHGMELVKALSYVLADPSCGPLVQSIELSKNFGIQDSELAFLTKTLVKLSSKRQLSALRHLNLSSIGASPSSLCSFIKALPQIVALKTLDFSNNALPFFCIDQLITSLRQIQEAPKNRQSKKVSITRDEEDNEGHLLKLNCSGSKLDELTTFQLCQGILQHSFVESLDLSNNVQLGHNFSKTFEQLLNSLRFKYSLKKVNLAHTGVSSLSMIKLNKLITKNRASTVEEAIVNRLYFPNKQQVPIPSHQSTIQQPEEALVKVSQELYDCEDSQQPESISIRTSSTTKMLTCDFTSSQIVERAYTSNVLSPQGDDSYLSAYQQSNQHQQPQIYAAPLQRQPQPQPQPQFHSQQSLSQHSQAQPQRAVSRDEILQNWYSASSMEHPLASQLKVPDDLLKGVPALSSEYFGEQKQVSQPRQTNAKRAPQNAVMSLKIGSKGIDPARRRNSHEPLSRTVETEVDSITFSQTRGLPNDSRRKDKNSTAYVYSSNSGRQQDRKSECKKSYHHTASCGGRNAQSQTEQSRKREERNLLGFSQAFLQSQVKNSNRKVQQVSDHYHLAGSHKQQLNIKFLSTNKKTQKPLIQPKSHAAAGTAAQSLQSTMLAQATLFSPDKY